MGNVLDNRLDAFNTVFNLSPSSSSDATTQSLQYKINDEFENASDLYTIQEEQTFGKLDWKDVKVRLVHVLTDKQTGQKLGDDYKEIIFQDINHAYGIGKRYSFDNNVWVTINSDLYHYVTASCIIRRCNNVLRWRDEFNNPIQEPCIIEYQIKLSTNDFNSNIITPKGWIEVTCQYNSKTMNILPNQRFLFGNPRVAYKVRGDGVNNFLNQNTYDDSSAPLIKLQMDVNQINNSMDDLVGGYANAYDKLYTISINQGTSLSQTVGYTNTLTPTVKKNGVIVTGLPLTWTSSNTSICTIQSNGSFVLNAVGSCTVTVAIQDNPSILASIGISVVAVVTNVKTNIISPFQTDILEGSEVIYTINSYLNNVVTADTFTVVASNVPNINYTLTVVNGNSFKIKNLKLYTTNALHVVCTNNVDATTAIIDINLKGIF